MSKPASPFVRFLIPVTVFLMALSCLALTRGVSLAAPAAPTLISPEDVSITVPLNPILMASAYSGSPGHQATQWQIDGSSDFSSPEWTRISTLPETQVLVNTANGTFANWCAGRSSLEMNMGYFWRVRYQDTNATWGPWSGAGFFITVADTWYLAEGCTAGGFETWVLVQNPSEYDAVVNIQFQTDTGPVSPPTLQGLTIPSESRSSFNVGAYVSTYNVSTKVIAIQGTIACERAMYGNGRTWGHDSIGVTVPSSSWYLAEGCTAGGMETWVLVQNPNASPVTVDLTLQTETGPISPPALQDVPIPAASRRSFNLGDSVSTYNVSTQVVSSGGEVICERAMYGNGRTWGHDSIGVAQADFEWAFAEGCTDGGMETWMLVANTQYKNQDVRVYVMDETGPLGYIPMTVGPGSRSSLNVGDYVQSYSLAFVVFAVDAAGEIDNTGEIVCERAMYGNGRAWGHDSIGSRFPAPVWTLPEGCTSGGFETWVLLANPWDEGAYVDVSFMTDKGLVEPPALQDMYLPAFARKSVNVGAYVNTYDVSTIVMSDDLIVCERAMYGYGRAWAHNSIGFPMGWGDPLSAMSTSAAAGSAGFSASSIESGLDEFPRLYPR